MKEAGRTQADLKKLWLGLDEANRDLVLYLVHTAPPVSIDLLGLLSDAPVRTILGLIEALKKRRLLLEKKEHGPGLYFVNGAALKKFVEEQASERETGRVLRRLIDFYRTHGMENEERVLTLSRLYCGVGDIGGGLDYVKKAADILHRSGDREGAVLYYDCLLRYFDENPPNEARATFFLDSVLSKVTLLKYLMPLAEQVALLSKAEAVARRFKRWDSLSRVKLALGRLFQASGRHKEASRCITDFWNLARKTGDPSMLKIATLLISEFLYWQGRFSEAARRYEEVAGDLEEFGDDKATLKAGARVGFSYVICGRIARGMGMIDAVRAKGNALNLQSVVACADFMSTLALFETRKLREAEFYLNRLSSFPENVLGHYTLSGMNRCKAYLCAMKGDYPKAFEYHKKAIEHSLAVGWNHHNGPWNLECLDILEGKGFFNKEWNYDGEIARMLNWDDIYMKGAAFRYRALRSMKTQGSPNRILADLHAAERILKRSGAEIELARTLTDLGNFHLKRGEPGEGHSYLEKAWGLFSRVDRNLFPKDLLVLLPQQQKIELMIERIIKINESLGGIQNTSSFLERVINVAMDFTMARRGAFFLIEEGGRPRIITSRNLGTLEAAQLELISGAAAYVAKEGKDLVAPGLTGEHGLIDQAFMEKGIHSFICMPIKLGDEEAVGCLYLDNPLGASSFPREMLTYVRLLCSQAAVGLSHIRIYDEMKEEKTRLEAETFFYKRTMGVDNSLETIIGESESMKNIIGQIRRVAPTDSTVLIMGETGVGKELVAKAIHNLSDRREGPFIPVNLAVLPRDLVASELFGHEKGAFTGAGERHKGRFELADGGTIFLDEVGDLPLDVQVKLLRVLQEGTFERLGSEKPVRFNFRVIAATHRNLDMEVEKGSFRQDLYYRLNVFPIYVPPLRDRREDIPLLAHHFVNEFARKMHKGIRRIPGGELRKLIDYHWPGNVRELEHFIERAVITSDGYQISFSGPERRPAGMISGKDSDSLVLANVEREHIRKVLNDTRWKVGGPHGAAAILGLKPTTLFFRMKRLGITKPAQPMSSE